MPNTLGQQLKLLRKKRRLTQRQLGERAGIDFTYISKVENDRLEHTPSVKTLQDLALALDADELELMALANKVPHALQAITQNREALRFFRRASETITSPEGWRELHAYLDRQQQEPSEDR